jgi:uncharacterized protein YoxC
VSLLDFFLIVAALSLAGVAIALVPMLVQLKRTAEKTELLVDMLQRDMSPFLQSLSETTSELRFLTASINQKVEKVDLVIDTIQDTGVILRSTAGILQQSVLPVVTQIGGFGAGIRAFLNYLTKSGKN